MISIKPREGSIGHTACMLDRQNEPFGPNAEGDVATLARKVDYLSRSDSYISAPETVTVRETQRPTLTAQRTFTSKMNLPGQRKSRIGVPRPKANSS